MEKPTYSEDSYADKFLKGYTIFQDDARIFHQVGCQYDVEVCNLDWDEGPWGRPETLFRDFAAKVLFSPM
jgi:hypothetical protein